MINSINYIIIIWYNISKKGCVFMGIYLLFQRYLDKQTDQRFVFLWEKYVTNSLRRFLLVMFIMYVGVMVLLGYLVSIVFGFFLTWLLIVVLGLYIGYDLIVETIKFLANNNQRYLLIKMSQKDSGINYENVVG